MILDVAGQRIVVTGGAQGIGSSVVRALVGEGADVAILDVAEERGRQVADDARRAGPGTATFSRRDVGRARMSNASSPTGRRVRGTGRSSPRRRGPDTGACAGAHRPGLGRGPGCQPAWCVPHQPGRLPTPARRGRRTDPQLRLGRGPRAVPGGCPLLGGQGGHRRVEPHGGPRMGQLRDRGEHGRTRHVDPDVRHDA